MKRMGMVIGVKPERIVEYKKTHAAVWPEVLAKISDCNIRNYTIFLRSPRTSFSATLSITARIGRRTPPRWKADPKTQEWWAIHKPMRGPACQPKEGDWWAMAEEVFHHD
jgi:L-rhamnose mutarotase